MNKLILFLVLIMGTTTAIHSQNFSGRILDDQKTPVADALIYLAYNQQHTHTGPQGTFTLKQVFKGDTIMISYLGYQDKMIVATARNLQEPMTIILEPDIFDLSQVSVTNDATATSQVTRIDLKIQPVSSSQEVLRSVPGLIIGQHAGGGKAEQIFLRGFDIDHGTDIGITVDGLPVNMVSHAHGQGYADLHFLIPETIENIDFGKGPYYTDHGNFATAGFVDFKTKNRLDNSRVGMEFGQFNTFRTFGLFDLLGKVEKQNAYLATEYIMTDGPVESPQNFNRFNIMGKYNAELANNDQISVLFSRFQSKWDASGQIPQRLVDDGTITRFGFVDNTEGGSTGRTNLAVDYTKTISSNTFVKTKAYYSKYDFELFSNFTFFLEDPVNGDQIKQRESRNIYGVQSTLFQSTELGKHDLELSYGLGLRYDDVNGNELSSTLNRQITRERIALGDVDETNISGFVDARFILDKLTINPGIRLDAFSFDYIDQSQVAYTSLSVKKAIASPKLNILYNPTSRWQVFLKSGIGFHSNDTRVVVAQSGEEILPAALGADLGFIYKPFSRLWLNSAVWYLYSQQEFVYVGDAGIVEPSGSSRRQGVDFGFRWQPAKYLFLRGDINYTHARSVDAPEGEAFIPLAPDLTSAGSLDFVHPKGFKASLRYRYVKDRPANEDNTITAFGYFITDINANYTIKNVTLGFEIQNLFDTEWNEAQFATESRLKDEAEPVEELHFTPGTPFYFKGTVSYAF